MYLGAPVAAAFDEVEIEDQVQCRNTHNHHADADADKSIAVEERETVKSKQGQQPTDHVHQEDCPGGGDHAQLEAFGRSDQPDR